MNFAERRFLSGRERSVNQGQKVLGDVDVRVVMNFVSQHIAAPQPLSMENVVPDSAPRAAQACQQGCKA